ncbi:hypothetical protein VTO42DRAFT_6682 [Malbranchea cinnamomea]
MAIDIPPDEVDMFDDHPSLSASLEDFVENPERRSPFFGIPSQHSGFRSEISTDADETLENGSSNGEPWSPPGYKRAFMQRSAQNTLPSAMSGSAWYRRQPYLHNAPDLKPARDLKPAAGNSPAWSREPSPQYEDALEKPADANDLGDLILPASIPLPPGDDSPLKRSPSPEPEKRKQEKERMDRTEEQNNHNDDSDRSTLTNYIRFAVRAEVQHREPFVAFFNYIGKKIDAMTQNRTTTILSVITALISIAFMRALLLPPVPLPVPDLAKLSGFARSFEPLIYYSENGVQQIGTLQETGVAVWDLGESVRGSNMTSAPIIVRELDELSESLKTLSLELTRFFANVDADIDSILIVMEWAKRELEALSSQPPISFPGVVFDNIHSFLWRLGVLETVPDNSDDGTNGTSAAGNNNNNNGLPVPTRLGTIVTALFGTTRSQRTHKTLTHAFTELVSVLEECINSELTHSTALFALFESIDRQFLNLQRTVVRESNAQERAEGEMLSSLWTRVLGPNAAQLRKYEKNKRLLASVRQRTVANKHLLMDHRGRLLALKVNLETLRRKLVSPLLRRNDSVNFGLLGSVVGPYEGLPSAAGAAGGGGDGSGGGGTAGGERKTLTAVDIVVEGQIRGLEGAYEYLRGVREKQKAKLMEMVYGSGRRTGNPVAHMIDDVDGEEKMEIDGS